jgi:thiamine biosynthesis protein ThiI
MKKIILVRYSEIHLKGNNRSYFEGLLISNIKQALEGFDYRFSRTYGRYQISGFDESFTANIVRKLQCVFGIHSISEAYVVENNMDEIAEACLGLGIMQGTFKVECNRADKTFKMKSYEVAAQLGSILLQTYTSLKVDLHKPDNIIHVDIRETKETFVFSHVIAGAGGLPVGSSGKGMLLLSGGIDSPVAGWLMAKRGMTIEAVHFHSYPFTSREAKEKVLTLAKKLSNYTKTLKVHVVPFTEIQTKIHEECPENYMITIMRRFMMRIAQIIAQKDGAGAIITGESLGQVASQTMESINVTNSVVKFPVFRPLIGFDKAEIVKIAQSIDTYKTSILPYEDCCTVFLPKNPVIKPKIYFAENCEKALDIEKLIENAIGGTEIVEI